MKRILILTVTAGEGHNSIAKAIGNKFKQEDVNNVVEIVDVFCEYSSKSKFNFINDGYTLACKYVPNTYNYFYRQIQKGNPEKRDTMAVQGTVKNETPFVLKKIYEFKPDIIYCSHFYGGTIITNLRKVVDIPAICSCLLFDYTVHPYWESAIGIDYLITPTNKHNNLLIKKGYNLNQLKDLGFPVDQKFSVELEKTLTRQKLNLDEKLFTVLVMKGGGGFGGNLKILKMLIRVKTKIQIIIVNGKDAEGMQDIFNFMEKLKSHHKIVNLGFLTNIDEILSCVDVLVGKCGGASLSETLNKRVPSIVINGIPQQEIDNKRFLVSNNACLTIKKYSDITTHIENLMQHPESLKLLKENINKIRKPNAINDAYKFLNSFPKANYKNVNMEKYNKYMKKFLPIIAKKEEIKKLEKIKQQKIAKEKQKHEKLKALQYTRLMHETQLMKQIKNEKVQSKKVDREKLLNLKTIKPTTKNAEKVTVKKTLNTRPKKIIDAKSKSTKEKAIVKNKSVKENKTKI